MKIHFGTLAIILLALLSCSNKGVVDPTYFSEGFKGITYMDKAGNPIGPKDPTDWGFGGDLAYPQGNNWYYDYSKWWYGPAFYARAFPNPTSDSIILQFDMKSQMNYDIQIVDSQHRVVAQFSDTVYYRLLIFWQPIDLQGIKLPYGIYRVYYKFHDDLISGFGDIWFTDKKLPMVQ